MKEVKPIRNTADHEQALADLRFLIESNPPAGSDDDARISVLAVLIEGYESATLPDYQSDPIESIKLRIEQLGLKDKDLAEYFGSSSRVSEVLSGKRPLTVGMIKNLEEGLGIPASILVGSAIDKKNRRWSPKTLLLMAKRGYFGEENSNLDSSQILDRGLLRLVFNPSNLSLPVLLRQSNYRDISNVDRFHLDAWANKVIREGLSKISEQNVSKYDRTRIDSNTIGSLFKLSRYDDGVEKIQEGLKSLGIVLIIEPHLPSTKLDGATFFTETNPIIGLTLRLDRLDNFWFTLAHELSHVLLHIDSDCHAFYDNLFGGVEEISLLENQADELASNILIPSNEWKLSPLKYASTPTLVKIFADKIGVHESVVAGRIRHESNNWVVLNDVVNDQKVRQHFGDKIW